MRYVVLVQSIVITIFVISQQFDDVNALQSPIFIRSLQFFLEQPFIEFENKLI